VKARGIAGFYRKMPAPTALPKDTGTMWRAPPPFFAKHARRVWFDWPGLREREKEIDERMKGSYRLSVVVKSVYYI